jgi:hypothetical protein
MPSAWYIAAERARLEKNLPEGVALKWLLATQSYQLTYQPPGEKQRKVLRTLSRDEILGWRNSEATLKFAAKRELREHGYLERPSP